MTKSQIQLVLSVATFAVTWLALWLFGARILDRPKVVESLNKKWLWFIKPRPRAFLVRRAWQPLLAALLAIWAHGHLAGPASYLKHACMPPPIFATPAPRGLLPDLEDLPVIGRERELRELGAFTDGAGAFSWWWFQGGDDVGLRRAISTWLDDLPAGQVCTPGGFDAGFLRYDVSPEFWSSFKPRRPTVIVVEDASERAEEARALLSSLGARSAELPHAVRVLLVDRASPDTLRDLDSGRRYVPHRYRQEPLVLSPLDTEAIREIAEAIARSQGVLPRVGTDLIEELATYGEGQEWLAIVTLARSGEEGLRSRSRSELFHMQVRRLRAQLERSGLPERCMQILALATLTRGLDWTVAKEFERDQRCLKPKPYQKVFHRKAEERIPPVHPQILGEYFVLDTLSELQAPSQVALIERAWATDPEATLVTLMWANADHPDHPKLAALNKRPATKTLLEPWAKFRALILASPRIDPARRDEHLRALRRMADEYPHRVDFKRTLAWGLSSATHALAIIGPSPVDFLISRRDPMETLWSDLVDIGAEHRADVEIQRSVVSGAINAFTYYADALGALARAERKETPVGYGVLQFRAGGLRDETYRKVYDVWNRMVAAAYKAFPADLELNERVASATVNVILAYSEDLPRNPLFEMFKKAIQVLYHLRTRFAEEPAIQLRVARGLVNAFTVFARQMPGALPSAWQDLQDVTAAFPSSIELQRERAIGAQNLANFFGEQQDWDRLEVVLETLDEVAARYPNDAEIHGGRAWGIANGAVAYASLEDPAPMLAQLEKLLDLQVGRPHSGQAMTWASQRLIQRLSKLERWEEVGGVIERLESFVARSPDEALVQRARAKWNLTATDQYGNGRRIVDMEAAWKRLRDAAGRFPNDPEMQADVAAGGKNVIFGYNETIGTLVQEGWHEERLAGTWREVESVSDRFPEDRDIQEEAARAAALTIKAYKELGLTEKMEAHLEVLNGIATRFPSDLIIRELAESGRRLAAGED